MVAYLGHRNADYYLRVFKKFETGGGILSWNWSTFFFTSPWFLYRRLWIWFFVFWLGLPPVAITVGELSGLLHPTLGLLMALFMYFGLVPIFSNYIFYRRALVHVAAAKAVSPRLETQKSAAERMGGTNEMGAWIFGVIVYTLVGSSLIFSVIPAIKDGRVQRRPVQQEAQIESEIALQVDGAVNASLEARETVELFYLENLQYPLDNDAAGYTPNVSEHYISGMWIHEGRIVIIFNEDAVPELRGGQLFLIPSYNGAGFSWTCGSPSIKQHHLPTRCRL